MIPAYSFHCPIGKMSDTHSDKKVRPPVSHIDENGAHQRDPSALFKSSLAADLLA